MIKKLIMIISLLVVIFMIAMSSYAGGVAAKPEEVSPRYTTMTEKGVTVSARYLDKKTLKKRIAYKSNPFLEYEYEPLVVVEIAVRSTTNAKILSNRAELTLNNRELQRIGEEDMVKFWNKTLKPKRVPTEYTLDRWDGWTTKTTIQRVIDNAAPAQLTVTGTEREGFLSFQRLRNETGKAVLSLPVYTSDDKLIHVFEFEFSV